MLLIKGQLSLHQNFAGLLISTVFLLSCVYASANFDHDKDMVAALVTLLSLISLGFSAKIISKA